MKEISYDHLVNFQLDYVVTKVRKKLPLCIEDKLCRIVALLAWSAITCSSSMIIAGLFFSSIERVYIHRLKKVKWKRLTHISCSFVEDYQV